MRENVNRLVGMAIMGLSAEMVGNQILAMTPETEEEKLYTFIANEKCIEQMAALNPEVNDYPEFFTELRKFIIDAFEEIADEPVNLQAQPDDDTIPTTGVETPHESATDETGKPA